jgi:hypothetical protein
MIDYNSMELWNFIEIFSWHVHGMIVGCQWHLNEVFMVSDGVLMGC